MLAGVGWCNETTDMDAGQAFARGLQRARRQKGLSQARLAEAASLSVQMVAALEQGDKAPSIATIDKLCGALGLSASGLFSVGEAKTSPDDDTERIAALLRGMSRAEKDAVFEIVRRVVALARPAKRKRA